MVVKHRISSMVLAALLTVSFITACGSTPSTSAPEQTTAPLTAEITETQTETELTDNLPPDLDFGGTEIKIVHRSDGDLLDKEIFSESETGDVVETAIFRRNQKIEDRLNIKIKTIPVTATVHGGAEVNTAVKKAVTAGSDEYDIAVNHMSQMAPLAVEGMYLNLLGLPYLDFEKPWWVKDFITNLTIDNKCYLMAGDITIMMIGSTYLMFYNKNLYENMFRDNMYDLVNEGKWTLDSMYERVSGAYLDLNGNSKADEEDQFGYCTTSIRFIDALLVGSDVRITEKDENGQPYFVLEQNPKTYQFVEKAHTLLYGGNHTWVRTDDIKGDVEIFEKFNAGTVLFITYTMMGASKLRDMEEDFGVIPMVKFDESQPEYTTAPHNGFSALAVITTTKNPEAVAAFCEAMCAESYKSVTPAYYEIALKEKYSRDPETQAMLDLIRGSLKFDFGYVNSASLNSVMQQFRDLVNGKPDKVASTLAKNMTKCQKMLEDYLAKYSELG
jgi:ABC-type glycerol-3-phosphate transport system substrate-binding protein